MKKRKLLGVYQGRSGETTEEIECEVIEDDAFLSWCTLLTKFNDEEISMYPDPRHQDIRVPISAEWINKKQTNYCEFKKSNLVTQQDKKGFYDLMTCSHCGRKKKSYSLDRSELRGIKCKAKR